MSPTSLKVVLRQMEEGLARDFKECFEMVGEHDKFRFIIRVIELHSQEILLAERFMEREDFFEGVRALLVEKDKSPKWNPPSLKEVSWAFRKDPFFKHIIRLKGQWWRHSSNELGLDKCGTTNGLHVWYYEWGRRETFEPRSAYVPAVEPTYKHFRTD